MEPMMFGSTPSSPSSPGAANSTCLPNFLIGDIMPNTPYNLNISPGRNKTPSSNLKNTSNIHEPITLRQKLFNQTLPDSPVPPVSPFGPAAEKLGPPKTGLFDTIDAAKKSVATPVLSSTIAHNEDRALFNESISRIHPEETFSVNQSYNLTSRLEQIDTLWVTVFGFPPNKRVPPQGNWIYLKFNNLNEVARALTLNGKCINNSIMIGVQLHHSKENKENNSIVTSPTRARSLRHSFVSPNSSNNVIAGKNVPQKSTGIVSKAMEYVFGW
ncbi:hypothetical protein ABEB36_013311 [Hypothenemus hampei]|uniref:Nucleoporin NUP35 n=1 Tax=Hypothenemus hampei TaxID=57062 RepID=A0ABD1E8G1_HYPHA